MARKNRVSIYDGVYHITTRVANRAMLLRPDEVKDRIADWIGSVAAFSGVEVWSWCVMENHLHLLVHVPPVPRCHWLDPADEPAAYAFGMRPPECRVQRWSPCGVSPRPVRPPVGFSLSDDEMVSRLRHLYGPRRADRIAESWASLRARGLGAEVDAAKERYCRRMYNVSQFAKTLKEHISSWYNAEYGHSGCLWQGRFHSGVVERASNVLAIVAAYIGYNPVRAGIASGPDAWRWSSYSLAVNDAGPRGERCREMYARMLGRPWVEVRGTLESVYADGVSAGVCLKELKEWLGRLARGGGPAEDAPDGDGAAADRPGGDGHRKEAGRAAPGGRCVLRASQAIHATMRFLSHGAYIGCSAGFVEMLAGKLPPSFPREGDRSLRQCMSLSWELPAERGAA